MNVRKVVEAAENTSRQLDAASAALAMGERRAAELHAWQAAADAEYALFLLQLSGLLNSHGGTVKRAKASSDINLRDGIIQAGEVVKAGLRSYAESRDEEALAHSLWEARGVLMVLQELLEKGKV